MIEIKGRYNEAKIFYIDTDAMIIRKGAVSAKGE